MKPGPPRICDCGECRACKHRQYRERYYKANAERLIQLSAEYRRRRKNHIGGTNKMGDKDAELDRKAAEWLAEHR